MPSISQETKKTKSQEKRIKWKEFREKWKDCEACPLYQTRSRICLARGQVPCDVLFIGEAPGQSEDTIGQPFVGPAGCLLDNMISEAVQGLCPTNTETSLPRLAFTNIVCCIPLDESGDKVAEPDPAHAKACSERLIEFVDKVAQPKLVILVGKFAAKYVKKFMPKHTWPTVEITHPAAILRSDIGQRGLLMQRNTVTIRDAFETLMEDG